MSIRDEKVKSHLNSGNQLRKAGKIAQAIEKYQQALWLNPDFIPALSQLAGIYEKRKEFDQASSYYQQILPMKNVDALNTMGNLEKISIIHNTDKASEVKNQQEIGITVSHAKESLEGLMNLGITARRHNEPEKALEHFQQVILNYPEHIPAYVQARAELQKLGRFDEASQYQAQVLDKYPQQVDALMRDRPGRINVLSKINQSKSYLEIGVNKGVTFNQIMIEKKVAVDPKFKFNYVAQQSESTKFYEITSDEFFRAGTAEVFDFIYLDGLHIFEQTFRDFCATLGMAHEKTIWLIDDTVPSDIFAGDRSQQRCNPHFSHSKGDR